MPFVLAGVEFCARTLPLIPELELHLMQDNYPQGSLDQEDYLRLMTAPPYWAFCWGGGQALARWILDYPGWVSGREIVDYGAGSGVAAIAALRAGARAAHAVDIDVDALQACRANGVLNGVKIATHTNLPSIDGALMLAADICYEEDALNSVTEHIDRGGEALIAESRLRDLSERFQPLQLIAEYRVRTFPDLDESENYDLVHIYRSK